MRMKELMEKGRNTWQDKDKVSPTTGLLKLFAVQPRFFSSQTHKNQTPVLHVDRQQSWGMRALPGRIISKSSLLGHMAATD